MPRVPDDYLDAVVFLYPSLKDAQRGTKSGACGFLVCYPTSKGFGWHHYVVTNRHCVEGSDQVVIRATTRDSQGFGMKTWETLEEDWILHPDNDLAICSVDAGEGEIAAHTINSLLSASQMIDLDLGPGDEVFIVGRFIHHDGKAQTNLPILHTGIISMLPLGSIRNPHTKKDESDFLIEVHSRGGYSGSPVFVYAMPADQVNLGSHPRKYGPQLWLLGAMWGHVTTFEPVVDPDIPGDDKRTGTFVRFDTNVAAVVPAWQIAHLMTGNEAAARRDLEEERRADS